MQKLILLIFLLLSCAPFGISQNSDAISSGERSEIVSEALGENRTFQVYLPPSYYLYPKSTYPTLYLIDGDYNFHYVTGLIELMCDISEEIPEMLVVGISDGGSVNYADQCNPSIGESPGKGDQLIQFLETELMPKINERYRTSGYDILQGHSRGGLFTTYAALQKPELFDVYHAISPALWWQDYVMLEHVKTKLTSLGKLPFRLFMTLANEKKMGVNRFAQYINEAFPGDANYKYTLLENENHGSVGLPSMQILFKTIFGKFKMTRDQFAALESPEAFVDHYLQLQKEFSYVQPIPSNRIGDAAHFYFSRDRKEELERLGKAIANNSSMSRSLYYFYLATFNEGKDNIDEASRYYHLGIYHNPNIYDNYLGVAGLAQKKGELEKSKKFVAQALAIAKKTKARQWMMNEIQSKMR